MYWFALSYLNCTIFSESISQKWNFKFQFLETIYKQISQCNISFHIAKKVIINNLKYFIFLNFQKKLVPSKEPISVLKLASILDQDEEEDDDEDENIPQEEIQQYLMEVSEQREELRRNLRQRFAQLCVNGL